MQEKANQGALRGIITNPETGEKRDTYVRIPIQLTPQALAKSWALKAMKERYGVIEDQFEDVHKAVVNEIFADYMAGYDLGFKRGSFSLEDFYANKKTTQK